MISEKMKELVKNSSTIRAMFEEGKRLSAIYGEENVFDYSLGNPNVEPPETIRKANLRLPRIAHLIEILQKEDKLPFDKPYPLTIGEARKMIYKQIKS
jgi:hypothetical protein